MKPSQIIAVDNIEMEALPSARDRLMWFYRDLVGLTFIEDTLNFDCLRFRSALLELRIVLSERARVEAVRRQALVSVRSLEDTARVLEEESIHFEQIRGWNWTDRRLSLLDPGGNRVELKQEWRRGVFDTRRDQRRELGPPATDEPSDKKTKNGADTGEPSGYIDLRSESGRS
jgi:catechol 2,3-dioxygenase-like lactoylglutathione lyase family enzyme